MCGLFFWLLAISRFLGLRFMEYLLFIRFVLGFVGLEENKVVFCF